MHLSEEIRIEVRGRRARRLHAVALHTGNAHSYRVLFDIDPDDKLWQRLSLSASFRAVTHKGAVTKAVAPVGIDCRAMIPAEVLREPTGARGKLEVALSGTSTGERTVDTNMVSLGPVSQGAGGGGFFDECECAPPQENCGGMERAWRFMMAKFAEYEPFMRRVFWFLDRNEATLNRIGADKNTCLPTWDDAPWPGSAGDIEPGATDHAALDNLGYDSSGHTGFASSEEVAALQGTADLTNSRIDALEEAVEDLGCTVETPVTVRPDFSHLAEVTTPLAQTLNSYTAQAWGPIPLALITGPAPGDPVEIRMAEAPPLPTIPQGEFAGIQAVGVGRTWSVAVGMVTEHDALIQLEEQGLEPGKRRVFIYAWGMLPIEITGFEIPQGWSELVIDGDTGEPTSITPITAAEIGTIEAMQVKFDHDGDITFPGGILEAFAVRTWPAATYEFINGAWRLVGEAVERESTGHPGGTGGTGGVTRQELDSALGEFTKLIPSQASVNNQLVDKNLLTDTVNKIQARYITPHPIEFPTGQWPSLEALRSGPWWYHGGPQTTPAANDYAVFISADGSVWRTTFSGELGLWSPSYKVNDRPFTADEVAVLASEMTLELTNKLRNIDSEPTPNSNRLVRSGGVHSMIQQIAAASSRAVLQRIAVDAITTVPLLPGVHYHIALEGHVAARINLIDTGTPVGFVNEFRFVLETQENMDQGITLGFQSRRELYASPGLELQAGKLYDVRVLDDMAFFTERAPLVHVSGGPVEPIDGMMIDFTAGDSLNMLHHPDWIFGQTFEHSPPFTLTEVNRDGIRHAQPSLGSFIAPRFPNYENEALEIDCFMPGSQAPALTVGNGIDNFAAMQFNYVPLTLVSNLRILSNPTTATNFRLEAVSLTSPFHKRMRIERHGANIKYFINRGTDVNDLELVRENDIVGTLEPRSFVSDMQAIGYSTGIVFPNASTLIRSIKREKLG